MRFLILQRLGSNFCSLNCFCVCRSCSLHFVNKANLGALLSPFCACVRLRTGVLPEFTFPKCSTDFVSAPQPFGCLTP
jgi:hypothetical protein